LAGSAWGDWALYTGFPPCAFESELGVQDPVGFWDSTGFTADGSVENLAPHGHGAKPSWCPGLRPQLP